MATGENLVALLRAVAAGEHGVASRMLKEAPQLAVARVQRSEELFVAECHAQVYAGDTALHGAAFAYDTTIARTLIECGADVGAQNRRRAEPLHAAAIGGPGSSNWNPERQRAIISYLTDIGADPNARPAGGVTPLHRAVRNRCSAAVAALLDAGAPAHDPAACPHRSLGSDHPRSPVKGDRCRHNAAGPARLHRVVVPPATPNQQRNSRRADRGWAIAAAILVLMVGGFVTLVLLWWASFNYEPWEPTPSDRRQILTGAAVVFALTIGFAALIVWRGFRERDERQPR